MRVRLKCTTKETDLSRKCRNASGLCSSRVLQRRRIANVHNRLKGTKQGELLLTLRLNQPLLWQKLKQLPTTQTQILADFVNAKLPSFQREVLRDNIMPRQWSKSCTVLHKTVQQGSFRNPCRMFEGLYSGKLLIPHARALYSAYKQKGTITSRACAATQIKGCDITGIRSIQDLAQATCLGTLT